MLSRRELFKGILGGVVALVVPEWVDEQPDIVTDESEYVREILEHIDSLGCTYEVRMESDCCGKQGEVWYTCSDPAYWGDADEEDDGLTTEDVVGIIKTDIEPQCIVACSASAIAYSYNMGAMWYEMDTPPLDAEFCCVFSMSDGSLWFGMSDGTIWKTPDFGKTWEHITIEPSTGSWDDGLNDLFTCDGNS